MDHNQEYISNHVKKLRSKAKHKGSKIEPTVKRLFSQLRKRAINNNRLSKELSEEILYLYIRAPIRISSLSRDRILSNVLDLEILKKNNFTILKKYDLGYKKKYNGTNDAMHKRLPGSYGGRN